MRVSVRGSGSGSGLGLGFRSAEEMPVSEVSSVDLPTDGKPTRPTRASPVAFTSNPSPAPCAPDFGPSKSSSRLYLASFALRPQMCAIVCLLICVRAISSSMSLIFATRDDMPPYYHGGRGGPRVGWRGPSAAEDFAREGSVSAGTLVFLRTGLSASSGCARSLLVEQMVLPTRGGV